MTIDLLKKLRETDPETLPLNAEGLMYDAADEIERLRAALLVAQQWMPTPTQAIEDSAKRDVKQVYDALGWSVNEQTSVKEDGE